MILRMAWSSMQFWQGSKGTHNIGVKDGFAHGMAKRAVLARRQAKGIIIEGCSRVRDDLAHGMAKCAVLASEWCILTDYGNTYDLLGSEKKKHSNNNIEACGASGACCPCCSSSTPAAPSLHAPSPPPSAYFLALSL